MFGKGIINGRVSQVIYKGVMNDIRCIWKNREILIQSISALKVGDKIGLKWDPHAVHVMSDKVKANPNEFKI
jgi:ABC-type Fe3+/spermidine/putrescine transport system ATPase subunit